MTYQDVDAMWEADAAAEWERLNEPDPCEKQMEAASVSIREAVQFLTSAEIRLADAMAEVFDTPMEYRIGSFLDSIEDIECGLKSLAEKYGRGERE